MIRAVRKSPRPVFRFKRGTNVPASGVQVPVLLGDGLAIDGRLSLVEGGALDAARDHDLADVDPIGLELLREQAHQLVLRCVGDAEAHQAVLNHHRVLDARIRRGTSCSVVCIRVHTSTKMVRSGMGTGRGDALNHLITAC